jgi:hypothetical protein
MGSEGRRQIHEREVAPSACDDGDDVHRLPKTIRQSRDRRRKPGVSGRIAREHEQLEARVRREQVLQLDRAEVRCADKYLRRHALSDNDVRCAGLICVVHDQGLEVVDPNAACKTAEGLKGRKKVRVRDTVLVDLRARLAREELCEFDIKVDQVLGVFSPLPFVL